MACSPRQVEESRTFDRTLWFAAACICACNLVTSSALGQQGRPRYLLTPSQIVGEMQNRQLPTRGAQVSLAVPITAGIANPPLEIQAVSLLNTHEMRLRLTCRDRSECLPFFATATFPEELSAASVPTKPDGRTPGRMLPVSAAGPAAEASASVKRAESTESPILRSGAPATLDFDEERVHIRIAVICLESGVAGDKIRVTTRDRKQIYIATILTPALLKGNF